ncbi:YceD family protein [Fluviicola taffensis]|uniref:DUF177 domain-containing protein n=1 Tax=Fluviicola taffensis (strain DSM 16823 / NCIMB 13979 / RW262) TaxID=755732 RepID=F2IC17_FLUTR|nr:DUF177 domain-containing protein [Fluviicola taffensis]AEA43243.1 protein of unknown function DUF177 [Fluviicola taffensis DSM 16823]
MKKSTNEFIIPFVGLKIGTYSYEFDINKSFFEGVEETLIEDAKVRVDLVFEKKETMMIAEFSLSGTVSTPCDRCNDPMDMQIHGDYRIVYKFGTEISEDENLIILHPETFELNVSAPIYELVVISLPARKIHPQGECNEEVMGLYNKYIVNANEPETKEWDEDDDDWDDEDDDNEDQGDWKDEDEEDDDSDEPDNDKPIDPRWSVLKNLN